MDSTIPENSPPGENRTRRLELVTILDDKRIRIIDTAGFDTDDDLPRAGDRISGLLQKERFRTAGGGTQDRFHVVFFQRPVGC
jgi:hypothetical protein